MQAKDIKKGMAYCGLICSLCREDGFCSCKGNNCCGKRTIQGGCYQYNCCTEKGIEACFECDEFPCQAENQVKANAFIRFIRNEGIDKFCKTIANNHNKGVKYHSRGIWGKEAISGDYDLSCEEDVIRFLYDM